LSGISISDTRYHDVWLVVPAFNEASVIGDVISDVRSVFHHVVCVDDGSRDDTGDIALRAGAHVVRHPVNLGQGAAIQTGVEYARRQPGAAVFATFDADGQHRVKDVIRMIDRLAGEDVDLVIGTRFADPGVVSHTPFLKRLVLRSAAALSRRSRRLGLTDAHNGLRVFNKTVADQLNLTMGGMSHADEFITLAYDNHWRVTEEPVEILYTEYSMSKGQPLLNGVNIIFDGWLRGRMSR
jgi:glycosyltransferase involved in cell wall biosynthesis